MLAILYLKGPGTGQAVSMSNIFCAARQNLENEHPAAYTLRRKYDNELYACHVCCAVLMSPAWKP